VVPASRAIRHAPKEDAVVDLEDGNRDSPFGHPVGDAVAVGHNTRTGPEFAQELWSQPRIQLRRQKERDHRSVPDIGIEQVLDAERHAVADTGPVGVRPWQQVAEKTRALQVVLSR
jgi:hypothetical protein